MREEKPKLLSRRQILASGVAMAGAIPVIAADGYPVRPVRATRLPLAMAQRLDVLIDLPGIGPYPIFAQVEGKRARTGIILAAPGAPMSRLAVQAEANAPPADLSLERRLEAVNPLASRAPDVTHRVTLAGAMMPYAWSLNDEYWPPAHGRGRPACGHRDAEPHDDGAPDAPSWPRFPGGRDKW
jgi:FtsP/CotA-like multicopper oxidase with cupredoxin domain